MKQRFTTTDVSAEVACLRAQCVGMRVANIYDLSPRTYLFKLARSGEDGVKVFLLMESGTRFHTTQVLKERPPQPSNFCLKLRKHIRSRRLEDVRQLGVDRIVDFTFGTGEATHHVLLELYSAGNVILTDGRYEVLTLLRSHRDDDRGMATLPRHPYPLATIRLDEALSSDAIRDALQGADPNASLRGALGAILPYGPQVTDRCLVGAGLLPTTRAADVEIDEGQLEALLAAVAEYRTWIASLDSKLPAGIIGLAKAGESRKQRAAVAAAAADAAAQGLPAPPEEEVAAEDLVYDDYSPVDVLQGGRLTKSFPTFDAAVAEFYSKVEGQRAGIQQATAKKQVLSKLDKARAEQLERVAALGREADVEEDQAALIEYNMAAVDAAIDALNAALARGLDWRDLAALIDNEKASGNPVAKTVAELRLDRNAAVLLLRNELDVQSDSDDEGLGAPVPATRIEVDLSMNAAANARVRHEARKRHTAKQRRTEDAASRVIAAAERSTAKQLAKVEKQATTLTAVRKPAWFERFAWFVSSENFLVISGRDAQQTELLVNRHLRGGDVFVHADLKGAIPTIVKNNSPSVPVPPLTISQAGAACVCHSSAWGAKIVTSAWWVPAEQVKKAVPSPDAVPGGTFTITGARRFLPPHPLIMGLGFLFVVDDASAAAHACERLVKSGDTATADAATGNSSETLPDTSSAPPAAAAVSENLSDSCRPNAAAPSGTPAPSNSGHSSSETDQDTDDASNDDVSNDDVSDNGVSDVGDKVGDLQISDSGESGATAENSGSEVGQDGAHNIAGDEDDAVPGRHSGTALDSFLDTAADPRSTQYSRYGLTDQSAGSTAEATSAHVSHDTMAASKGTRHLSAAARRAARKQGLPAGAVPSSYTAGPAQHSATEGAAPRTEPSQVEAVKPAPAAPRGTRGKARRAVRQYADQDDEDRQVAMAALASSGTKKVKGDRKEARKARRDARRPEERAPGPLPTAESLAAVNARPIDTRRTWGWERTQAQEAVAATSSRQPGHVDGDSSADVAPAAHISDTAGADDDDGQLSRREEEDRLRLTDLLGHMTGIPREEDTLAAALPVCAPYQVLAAYRYKVKLTPGSQKKGKAARQAAGILERGPNERHSDAIRSVPEADIIAACIGGVKVSVPGMQLAKRAAKKTKKGKK